MLPLSSQLRRRVRQVLDRLFPGRQLRKKTPCRLVPRLEALEDRLAPAIITVNDAGDAPDADPLDGVATSVKGQIVTTLRAAIQHATYLGGENTINFAGDMTIAPSGLLPVLPLNTKIIAPTNSGMPRVELQGRGTLDFGLRVSAHSEVRGLNLNGFKVAAISFATGASGAGAEPTDIIIAGNYLGTNRTGTAAVLQQGAGIDVLDKVVQRVTIQDNIISGMNTGVRLSGSDNKILNNLVGTDRNGKALLGNSYAGIYLADGRANEVKDNVIANNDYGLYIDRAYETVVQRNFIGTDRSEALDMGNGKDGIVIYSSMNRIGGDLESQGNAIAWNGREDDQHKGNGISLRLGTGKQNAILSNRIYQNGNRGIAFYRTIADGWDAGDQDNQGPNLLQNAPYADTNWQEERDHPDRMVWRLQSRLGETYHIQVFSSRDDDGRGSAHTLIDDFRLTADQAVMTFSTIRAPFLSATATDSKGNTSEIGMGDYDADGLYDWWEKSGENYGIDYNQDGKTDQYLVGANWHKKDVYVEIDAMVNFAPTQATIDRVVQAFGIAPVGGGILDAGITLHANMAEADQVEAEPWSGDILMPGPPGAAPDYWPSKFDALKQKSFGTEEQRGDHENWDNIRSARLLAYRYCVFAQTNTQPGNINYSGTTENPGDDIIITLGSPKLLPVSNDSDTQATLFMHELGHSLGLHHGGGGSDPKHVGTPWQSGDDINRKPNYRSVMNYIWNLPPKITIWHDDLGPMILDYSRDYPNTVYRDLDEENLDDGQVPARSQPDSYTTLRWDGTQRNGQPNYTVVPENGGASGTINWSNNSYPNLDVFDGSYKYDINADGDWTVLKTHEDWHELWFNFRSTPFFGEGGSHGATLNDEELSPPLEDGGLTRADLVLTQADSPASVVIGNNVVYTLTLVNNGPHQANNVQVIDTLPKGVAFVSATASQGTYALADNRLLTFTVGSLASGARVTLTITAKTTKPGVITNNALAITSTTDSNWANNFSAEDTTVTQNLKINSLPPAGSLQEGQTYTGSFGFTDVGAGPWTATINYGDGTASEVRTFATRPASIALSHLYGSSGAFTLRIQVANSATGQVAEAAVAVAAANRTPTVAITDPTAPQTIRTGDAHTFRFAATDWDDRFVYQVNWGDGSAIEESFSNTTLLAPHTYANPGNYTIRAVAIDPDGAESAEATFVVTVAAPVSYYPTALEQEFFERLNDARANPAAYGAALGLNLSTYRPVMPETFDIDLMEAARKHAQDMLERGYYSHFAPEGDGPSDRAADAGYRGLVWESISYGVADPDQLLALYVIDAGVSGAGHRVQLLGTAHRQIGVGLVGTLSTIDSGINLNDTRPYLTGSVFNDLNNDGRYDAGEGVEGVTISIAGVGATTTWSAGGYSYQLNPGTYTVTASGGGLTAPISRTVTFDYSSDWGLWENERLNFAVNVPPPNDVLNPAGSGANHNVKAGDLLDYRVRFGNTHTGNPVQRLQVRQTLDSDLDRATFELGNIQIGATTVVVPAGRQSYSTRVYSVLVGSNYVNVDVSAALDAAGVVTWTFQTIDPATGAAPTNPALGFLPYRGAGEVSYRVRSRTGLSSGTTIDATAMNSFTAAGSAWSVTTSAVLNTIDATAPTSRVNPLAAYSGPTFTVSWSGQDNLGGAGLAAYDIYVSDNGSPFTRWQWATTQTSATFTGQIGHTYRFYSVATDLLGQRETTTTAQVQTTVHAMASATFTGGPTPQGHAGQVRFGNINAADYFFSYDFNNDGDFSDAGEIANSLASSAAVPVSYLAGSGPKVIHGRISNGSGQFVDYATTVSAVDFAPWQGLGGFLQQTTTGVNADGSVVLFGIGGDGAAWLRTQNGPNGAFASWVSLGGYVKQLAVGRNANGALTLFAIGGDSGAWMRVQNGPNGAFGAWTSLGGFVKDLAVGQNANGALTLFAIGGDNAVWMRAQNGANGAFGNWTSLSGFVQQLSVGQNADGSLALFAIGGDNGAWVRTQSGPNGAFGNWTSLGGYVKQLTVGRNADGRLALFAIGGDNAAWTRTQTTANGGFGAWTSLGGFVQQITIGQNNDGSLTLFAIGGDNATWTRTQTAANGGFGAWTSLGGFAKQLRVARTADGTLTLLAIGGDNAAYLRKQQAV